MTGEVDKRWLFGVAALLLAGAVGAALWSGYFADSGELTENYPSSKLIRYGFTVRNTSGELLKETELRVFAPVRQTARQRTVSVEASHPFETTQDALGNQILHFRLTIPPYGVKVVSISARLELAQTPNPSARPPEGEFVRAERYVEADDPRIRELAQSLPGKTPIGIARAAFDWVSGELRDVGYIREDRGALYAIESGQGDCTEHMYLFTALLRARGIPARGLGGFVVGDSAVLRSGDFHNWAEFHAAGRWHLADPQRRVFDDHNTHYVTMRIIGDQEASPMGTSHRFLAFHDKLEVRMN